MSGNSQTFAAACPSSSDAPFPEAGTSSRQTAAALASAAPQANSSTQTSPSRLKGRGAHESITASLGSVPLTSRFLNPRFRSLTRANFLVLGSLALSFPVSQFPHLRPTPWLLVPLLGIAVGTADTARCMRKRWDFYHGGVILCIYMDLMVLVLVSFLLLYPALS